MHNLHAAKVEILKARSILVAGHINPDGDSIGSLLSLGLGLEKIGKNVCMLSVDGVPHRYRGLPGAGRIVQDTDRPWDLAISVDCSTKEILGRAYNNFKKAGKILEIDHHVFRRPFGDITLLDNNAAAVGELVYKLLEELRVPITKAIAQNLVTSIIVETSSFRLPKVTPFTFEACTRLIRAGIDFHKLVDTVFWSKRKQAFVLAGMCMARCKFIKNDRIAWSIITRKDMESVDGKDEDVDPVPDDMRSIKTVKIALLFREYDNKTLRVSLRSKGKINVGSIAEYFDGGGHFDVAGCSIPNRQKAIDKVLERTAKLLT